MSKRKEDETFLEAKARVKQGQRGKSAEGLVEEVLQFWKAENTSFDFDRLPDTRSAGRIMPARASDFTVFHGRAYSLEVKEVKAGLLLKEFVQYPRMQRRAMAGCLGLVLVHLLSVPGWVLIDLGWLKLNHQAHKSWDLGRHQLYPSAGKALQSIFNLRLP